MKLNITIDKKQYEVEVEVAESEAPSAPARIQSVETSAVRVPTVVAPVAPTETSALPEDKVCRSPVSGIVASITAQPGQKLQAGDVLLVLEAMKMETQVTAHVAGQVATIKVKAGDSVHSGQVLVEFA